MTDKEFYILNPNVSRFMIPFYLDATFERKHRILFDPENWTKTTREATYLTKYIQEIYGDSDDGICLFYNLNKSRWTDLGLPVDISEDIMLKSHILGSRTEVYTFRLIDVTAVYFSTGMGFLLLDIRHDDKATLKEIVDASFALSNIFSENRDTKEPKVEFSYNKENTVESFSIRNAIPAILMKAQLGDRLEIFPTSGRKRLNAYHRLFRARHEENESKLIFNLTRGLHSSFTLQEDKYDFLESDFRLSPSKDTVWSISSNGAVSISYKNRNNQKFLAETHPRHVDVDYFLVYLLAIHEREILLKYNYDAVKNWSSSKQLTLMKEKLIKFNIWFSYNTVSIENSYQNFYECMYRALNLEKLEHDIQDVITQVNEAVSTSRERKINAILSSIAVLAVFSVFSDGIGFVDRLYDPAPLQAGHYTVIILIIAVICYGVFRFFRRKK